jgi:RNA polymerase sigma factor (sigma-70 family)
MQQIETHTRFPSREWVTIYAAPAPRKTIAQRLKEKRPAPHNERYGALDRACRNPRTYATLCAAASPFARSTRVLREQFVGMPLYEPEDFLHDAIVSYMERGRSLDTLVKNPAGYIAKTIKNKGRNHVTRNKLGKSYQPPAIEDGEPWTLESHVPAGASVLELRYVTSETKKQAETRTKKYAKRKREQQQRRRYLQSELALLPDQIREVVELYHGTTFTLDQVSRCLGIDRRTVIRRLRRGREELSEIIRSGRAAQQRVIPPHKRAYTYGIVVDCPLDVEQELEKLLAPDVPELVIPISESLQRAVASGVWERDNPIYRALHSSLL